MTSVRVWDIPVRLFHWLLVITVFASIVSAKLGGNWMEWHQRLGFFALGLIIFRLLWGVVGSQHARFSSFVRGPSAVWQTMREIRQPSSQPAKHYLGHNPMGALSVMAILAVVLFQASSGLFADDDILMRGPYADAVSKQFSDWLTKLHKLNSNVLIGLIVLHLSAIGFYYFVKRENLVKPMITGTKSATSAELQAVLPETPRPVWLAWLVVIVACALTYAVVARPFW